MLNWIRPADGKDLGNAEDPVNLRPAYKELEEGGGTLWCVNGENSTAVTRVLGGYRVFTGDGYRDYENVINALAYTLSRARES